MPDATRDPAAIKETIRRHWAGRAARFDEAPNHGLHSDEQHRAWLARVSAWAGPRPVDALDVGCGTGFLALLLAELGHRVVGVDGADEMLDLAASKAAVRGVSMSLQWADAEWLPFADAAFDLVVERHVLWTLPDPVGALAGWSRVLRPGGRLVLVEGAWRSTSHPDYAAIRDALPLYGGRPAAELAQLAAAAGLVDPVVEPLMEAVLWGDSPERERYALHARKPG
jgi:ubiquinone/menaquinone biosynthesis C-methylase UbiE